jgi:hypothetical protein
LAGWIWRLVSVRITDAVLRVATSTLSIGPQGLHL